MEPVVEKLLKHLETFNLLNDYPAEEPHLLEHVQSELTGLLGADLEIVTKSWNPEDSVEALGGGFWPDIVVQSGGGPVLAVELGQVKPGRSPTKALAETIGQCLLYRAKYPHVVGLVVNRGLHDEACSAFSEVVLEQLRAQQIHLVIRRR